MLHSGYEGSDHCSEKHGWYNPLTLVCQTLPKKIKILGKVESNYTYTYNCNPQFLNPIRTDSNLQIIACYQLS